MRRISAVSRGDVHVFGGAGDDRIRLGATKHPKAGSLRFAYGGFGDDHLVGSAFEDRLQGGPGTDVLDGRGGFDFCRGAEVRRNCEVPHS